jgi:hypothetical protein
MNIFEKKPMKGGTPAIENSARVKNSKYEESKLKLENEYKDLEDLTRLDDIIQKTTISVMLYMKV